MSKDKIYGAIIFVIALIALIWYTLFALVYGGVYGYLPTSTEAVNQMIADGWPAFLVYAITLGGISWRWGVIGPLYLAAVLILGIAMWIGYTMITTPPPVPLEELEELGLEDEEEESGES